MSADADGDSQMASSYEFSEPDDLASPAESASTSAAAQILTPPARGHGSSSSGVSGGGGGASAAVFANANGKRPLNTISNGHEEDDEAADGNSSGGGVAELTPGRPPPEFAARTHAASGYSWTRAEDEPGAGWLGKRAVDEFHRAVEAQVHKEHVVLGRYGDPFDAAERERAVLEGLERR